METIIFIGSNKSGSSYEAIKASADMRYYTVLLTDRKSFFDKRTDFPHVHSMRLCDLNDTDEIRSAVGRLAGDRFTIRAIVSFIDPYCHAAAVLSREFGLKYFNGDAIALMLDKVKSRNILAGTPYAPFYRVADGGALTMRARREMPLVLKAPASSASRDVHMAWTAGQYQKAFAELKARYPDAPVLAEKFINGPQYLVETLTVNGRVNIIAIIEQEITFTGRFIVTGYKMAGGGGAFYDKLKQAAVSIAGLHGMRDGPCHLELRRSGGEWKLIEANPRISGGAMNLFIETAYGVNLAKETLRLALGFEPDIGHKYRKETFLQYVVVPEGGVLVKVTGKNAARVSPGVEHVYVKPKKGSLLMPPVSMGQRYAYVIGTGATSDEAMKNAKTGASKIKFHLSAADGAVPPAIVNKDLGPFSDNVVMVPTEESQNACWVAAQTRA